MGCTAARIMRWVVNLIIFFVLSNSMFIVCAKYSGVTTEFLELATTLLTVTFLCDIFYLDLKLLMRIGAAYCTFIDKINVSSAVSTTSELVTDLNTRWLSWKKSARKPLLHLLDIYATYDSSPYGMFLSIVKISGSYYPSPYIKTMWAKFSNQWSDGT